MTVEEGPKAKSSNESEGEKREKKDVHPRRPKLKLIRRLTLTLKRIDLRTGKMRPRRMRKRRRKRRICLSAGFYEAQNRVKLSMSR